MSVKFLAASEAQASDDLGKGMFREPANPYRDPRLKKDKNNNDLRLKFCGTTLPPAPVVGRRRDLLVQEDT